MTKRQAAFALFKEGKNVSSPEVEALGLKRHTRDNYFWEWKQGAGEAKGVDLHSGETIGSIDETKQPKKEAEGKDKEAKSLNKEAEGEDKEAEGEDKEAESEDKEANSGEGVEPEESKIEKPKAQESIGEVDESRGRGEKKEEEGTGKKGKYEITVADQGIKCTIYLSLQTLALYEIAAAKQAKLAKDGEAKLSLGDYLDNCSEHFFKDRKLKLGLVEL